MRTLRRIPERRINLIGPVFVILATFGVTGHAAAYTPTDVQAGKELAMKACSSCHAINSQRNPEQAPQPSGPSFAEIAKGTKATAEALRVFLLSTHSSVSHPGAMPSPSLTEDQIHLISAYVSSLRNAR